MLLLLLPSEYVYPVSHRLSGALFFKGKGKGKGEKSAACWGKDLHGVI